MFNKNLKYYRLKRYMSKKELAELCGLSPMAITNYENGTRNPDMNILKRMADVLGIRISDFLTVWDENLEFSHGEFRKTVALSKTEQDYIRSSTEEYFNRFFSVLEILGGEVLPDAPKCYSLPVTGDWEEDAQALRGHLGLAASGPIRDLISVLENKGILVNELKVDNTAFSGMNGFVSSRPYIVLNESMSTERKRSTIVHELAHLMFCWGEDTDAKEIEKSATCISGCFLFPQEDALRELGLHRESITMDMAMVCKEYGISMFLLAKRAEQIGIISSKASNMFYVRASTMGWRSNEPSRIEPEHPELFEQLVFRAANENEISYQKAAELLKMSYKDVIDRCCFKEGVIDGTNQQ